MNITPTRVGIAAGFAAFLAIVTVAGCGTSQDSKINQPYNDSHVQGHNDNPATIGNMPDGFSNWATKCDHGNRVYILFHGDSAYGGIAVAPNDPTCKASASDTQP